jgi:hypothetical protein|uniref:Uncharacterized protein n=1 Tax=viral metagenome TaxID=1070528 RepID=A0A6C0L9X0_9ZZZZ
MLDDMTPNERYNDKHAELKERQIRLDKLLKNQGWYPIIINTYKQKLTNSYITKENKEEYNKTIEYYENLLKDNETAIESIKKEIRESIPNVTENLLKETKDLGLTGGKRKSKRNSKKVAKKPVASQKKQSIYKEILGKQMKIYKMPDSRKEYVKYKGDLHLITDYKDLMKQKAIAKTKTKATQQKTKSKTKK